MREALKDRGLRMAVLGVLLLIVGLVWLRFASVVAEPHTPEPIDTPHGKFYPYTIRVGGYEYLVIVGKGSCSVCPAIGAPVQGEKEKGILDPSKKGGL